MGWLLGERRLRVRESIRCLRKRLNEEVRRLRTRAVAKPVRQRVDVTQLTTRAKLSIMMSVIGATVALALFWSFYGRANNDVIGLGFIAVISNYFFLILLSKRWLRVKNKTENYQNFAWIFQLVQFALGVSWAVVMIETIDVGSSNQRGLVYALAIALISTTMVSGPAKYSLSFWLPVTVGAFVAFLDDTAHFYAPILVALGCYSILSLYSIISLDKKMFERELNNFDLERHSETIELLLKDFQEGSGSFLWEVNSELMLTSFSDQIDLFSVERQSHDLTQFFDLLDAIGEDTVDEAGSDKRELIQYIKNQIGAKQSFKEVVIRVRTRAGPRWWAFSGKPIFGVEGKFLGYRGVCSDVTEREEYRLKIEFSATRDYLTKVYNRASFNRILEEFCRRESHSQTALLCIDLDHFKSVNDNFGHAMGDEMLIAVSRRIATCVRGEDRVFRLGGDEFAIAIPGADRERAKAVANRIVEKLTEPFHFRQIEAKVGASVGIALIPDDGDTPDVVHRKADIALYRAKSDGRGGYRMFDRKLDNQVEIAQDMQLALRSAVDEKQLSLMFQPIVELRTGNIVSAEALLRWEHPDFGLVPPSVFVPLLEQSGQIIAVGEAVISWAVRISAMIREDISLAINLSPHQLTDASLPQKIFGSLSKEKVSASRVEFEITESSLLGNDARKLDVLREIKKIGCRISLDDFGTGYSSMRLLDEFPFDKLKIDESFINGDASDSRRAHILEAMIQLGKRLGLAIVGEGISTKEQADRLVGLGCSEGQGFYFMEPIVSDEFVGMFSAAHLVDVGE